MQTDNILYYPYINIPKSLWTSRALLYWDNIGVIVPEEFIHEPAHLDGFMRDLVSANLVDQIIPRKYTQNLPEFKKGFLDIILSSRFNINSKRRSFERNNFFRIHVEKFDNGIMEILKELGLARWDNWPWWFVEQETARMLMTYLASVISIIDNRNPVTDEIVETGNHRSFSTKKTSDEYETVRNRLLSDIIPLPTEIRVKDLVKIKEDHQAELKRFRLNVEMLLTNLALYKDPEDFERQYRLQILEIMDSKDFISGKLSEPKFGKIVFGTLCSLAATGISVAQTPKDLFYWTFPSILSTAWTAIEGHRKDTLSKREPFSYLALIDKQIGKNQTSSLGGLFS